MELENKLVDSFFSNHPSEAAQTLNNIDAAALGKFLETLKPKSAAKCLEKIPQKTSTSVLQGMKSGAAAKLLEQLPFDAQLVFIHSLEANSREQILEVLPDSQSRKLHRLLNYPEGSAGFLMDPSPVSVLSDCLVDDALQQIRIDTDSDRYYLYVTDAEHRLIGMVTLQALLKARKQVSVDSIMSTNVACLPARASERDIIDHPFWLDFHELPVVNRHRVFIGVIRYDTFSRLKSDRSSAQPGKESLTTLLALSELYWLGMTGFLDVVSIPTIRDSNNSNTTGETNDV